MTTLIETALNGLLLGALYGLFALGLSLNLGVMKMINLAHGDFLVVGAYVGAAALALTGWPALATLVLVVPAMAILGWLLQSTVLHRVVGQQAMSPLLVSFGLSVIVQNLLLQFFSADTRSIPSGELALQGVDLGGVQVGVFPLLVAAVSVGIYALTHWLVAHTHWGRQARAVADDAATARLVGVNDRRFFAGMGAFVMAVTGLAAVFFGMRAPFAPSSGPERLLFAFEAVVLGGLGSLWGSFVGGLLIGLAQVAGARINTGLGPFFGHLLFLLALLWRPRGIFTRGTP